MTQTTPSHSQSVEAAEAHIVQLVREFADDYAESGPSSTKANAVWAAIKAAFNPCSPTVADVEAAVGMSAGAWDCVAPEKIIAAVIELTGRRAELTSQQEVAAPVSDDDLSEAESVSACLGDDAHALRIESPQNEEIADNMERAAELLDQYRAAILSTASPAGEGEVKI